MFKKKSDNKKSSVAEKILVVIFAAGVVLGSYTMFVEPFSLKVTRW